MTGVHYGGLLYGGKKSTDYTMVKHHGLKPGFLSPPLDYAIYKIVREGKLFSDLKPEEQKALHDHFLKISQIDDTVAMVMGMVNMDEVPMENALEQFCEYITVKG